MTSYLVVGQRGAFLGERNDMSERHKSELYQRLEAIADTDHQAVALVEHILHFLHDLGVAEERVNELRRALGLIAAAEAAGK